MMTGRPVMAPVADTHARYPSLRWNISKVSKRCGLPPHARVYGNGTCHKSCTAPKRSDRPSPSSAMQRLSPTAMRSPVYAAIVVAWLAGDASARLPPLSDAAKSQAAESTHRSAWADKVASYKLCQSMDRVAEAYRAHALTEGKPPPAAEPTPPCVEIGRAHV